MTLSELNENFVEKESIRRLIREYEAAAQELMDEQFKEQSYEEYAARNTHVRFIFNTVNQLKQLLGDEL